MFELPTGEELRKFRTKARLTQTELAKRAGVSQSLIARIEAGDIDPRLSTLRKILGVLKSKELGRGIRTGDIMKGPVVHAKPRDTLADASRLMEDNGFSQLPVLDSGVPVGSISEEQLVREIASEKDFRKMSGRSVREAMNECFPTVSRSLDVTTVSKLLDINPAVLVVEKGRVVGIVTKADIIQLMYR